MKNVFFSTLLLGAMAATPATAMDSLELSDVATSSDLGQATLVEEIFIMTVGHLPDRKIKMKKGRKATYGKKKGSKGTSCKKASKIMKRRGNW